MPAVSQVAPLRILYLDGPGDVVGTYMQWKTGVRDPRQLAKPYSGQFFSLCRDLGAKAYVIATCERPAYVADGDFVVEHRPIPCWHRTGWRFHAGQPVFAAGLLATALRFRADIALVSECVHWFLLAPLAMLGIPVVPMMHCTLWPKGFAPRRRYLRLLMRLNGTFWRRHAAASLVISAECARQISQVAGGRMRGPVFEARPSFYEGAFDQIGPAPVWGAKPFRVLFAGRVEASKGVFDVLETAARLEREAPGRFAWDICGDGKALPAVRAAVEARGLAQVVNICGYMEGAEMTAALGTAHAVIAPTTEAFNEGLNKTVVEAVLAGRPVVASALCPAVELLQRAVSVVASGDIGGYAAALRALEGDPAGYRQRVAGIPAEAAQFRDERMSWEAGLRRVITTVLAPRETVQIKLPRGQTAGGATARAAYPPVSTPVKF